MFGVVCYTTPACAVSKNRGSRAEIRSMQITIDQIQLKTMHLILYLLSIFLFKNKLLLLIAAVIKN